MPSVLESLPSRDVRSVCGFHVIQFAEQFQAVCHLQSAVLVKRDSNGAKKAILQIA